MTTEEFLKHINDGIVRGAKLRLSQKMDINSSTVLRWFSGQLNPSEANIKKMSKMFKVSEAELNKMFGITGRKRERVGFVVVPRTEGEHIPTLSAIYHCGEVIFMDNTEYSPSEENPMLINIKITEDVYAPLFKKGEWMVIDSRGKAEEGKVCIYQQGEQFVLGRINRGDLISLGKSDIRLPLSEVRILGVATKKVSPL